MHVLLEDQLRAIKTPEDFMSFGDEYRERPGYTDPAAWALGIGFFIGNDLVAAQYPLINIGEGNLRMAALISAVVERTAGSASFALNPPAWRDAIKNACAVFDGDGQPHPNIDIFKMIDTAYMAQGADDMRIGNPAIAKPIVTFVDDLGAEATNAADVYLRVHLLSQRKVAPNTINIGPYIFGKLETLAWTNFGIYRPKDIIPVQIQIAFTMDAPPMVYCLDKLPPMLAMVVPEGVRVADGQRARLGAHLAEGTTLMHEGFVNFNAGTLGTSMVEGRLSQGVTVGRDSDIGGGVSTQGTLSGGNKVKVSVGEDCLLEAESGIGIPLGDRVRIEAGLYVKSTTPVRIGGSANAWMEAGQCHQLVNVGLVHLLAGKAGTDDRVKAAELTGISDAIFRRNDGIVEVIPRGNNTWGGLNEVLHKN